MPFQLSNGLIVSVVVVIFLAFLLFAQFLYWTTQDQKDKESRELSRRLGTLVENAPKTTFRLKATPDGNGPAAKLDVMIRRAGSPYPLSSLYIRVALAAAVMGLVGVAITRSPVGLLLMALGAIVPVLVLQSQADERARKLTEQLPDGLDLIARSLQAGHGISEAFRLVSEEAPQPLGQEFGRVYEENNLGRDLRECLQNLNARNPANFDLQIFVSAVLLQRDTGGNLVEILNSISQTVRARFIFQGKVQALTAEARLTGVILCGLPFVITLAISIISPDYLKPLVNDRLGIAMLLYAFCSFSFGVFVMREVSKVEA
jgi:tight adherence protein B